jgi:hypothetical protein
MSCVGAPAWVRNPVRFGAGVDVDPMAAVFSIAVVTIFIVHSVKRVL